MRRCSKLGLVALLALAGVATGCALEGTDETGVGGAGLFLEQEGLTVGDAETPVETLTEAEVAGAAGDCAGVWLLIDKWRPALVEGTRKAAIVDESGHVVCVDDADEVTRGIAAEYGVEAARDFVFILIGAVAAPVADPTPQPAMNGGIADPTPQPAADDEEVEDPTPQPAREIHDPTPQPAR
ncbi:MAG: hypothetical protein IT379_15230 [Deltaproteobacteria bacterium]|nr:hypothetical protein [Deltaproteobacteria bacterium]